jgi:hypothetical protein
MKKKENTVEIAFAQLLMKISNGALAGKAAEVHF